MREVTELISSLFASQNIVVKKLHGQTITCSRMVDIIKTYWRHLTDEQNRGVESLVDVHNYSSFNFYLCIIQLVPNVKQNFEHIIPCHHCMLGIFQ